MRPNRPGRPAPAGISGASEALELIDRARTSLLASCRAVSCTDRYVEAQLGALRAAAAVVATGSHRVARGGRVRSVWQLLAEIAPELAEWAEFFQQAALRRREIETGSVRVGSREADDLLRAAESFLFLVHGVLGVPVAPLHEGLAVLETP